MHLKYFSVVSISICLLELILCFWQPMSFIQKPSIAFFPIFSDAISNENKEDIEEYLYKNVEEFNSFEIISLEKIEEYLSGNNIKIEDYNTEFNEIDSLLSSKPLNMERLLYGSIEVKKNSFFLKDRKSVV